MTSFWLAATLAGPPVHGPEHPGRGAGHAVGLGFCVIWRLEQVP